MALLHLGWAPKLAPQFATGGTSFPRHIVRKMSRWRRGASTRTDALLLNSNMKKCTMEIRAASTSLHVVQLESTKARQKSLQDGLCCDCVFFSRPLVQFTGAWRVIVLLLHGVLFSIARCLFCSFFTPTYDLALA